MTGPTERTTPGIDAAMADRIDARLSRVETDYQVRILYACESGSRGWGFESSDSDYDVRFVYVHALPWYLQVVPGRDVIEPRCEDPIDMSGWDLRKALRLLQAGNAQLIEWLDSPIIYRADQRFLDQLAVALPAFHRPDRAFHHYLHMAARNFRQYIEGRKLVRIKKYLYVLRPVLAAGWIEQGHGPAPMRFQQLVDAVVMDPSLKVAIDHLLVRKRAGLESEREPPIPEISSFLEQEFARLKKAPMTKGPVPDPTPLDGIMVEAVRHWGPILS